MAIRCKMYFASILVGLTYYLSICLAVKEYLFKTCENSGFCKRNRELGRNIVKDQYNFESPYQIDASSIRIDEAGGTVDFDANIIKVLPDESTRNFPLKLSLIEGNILRFKVDEEGRDGSLKGVRSKYVNHRRYNETPKWAFANTALNKELIGNVEYILNESQLIIKYGDARQYKAVLDFKPIRLTVLYQDEEQLVVNDKQFFNIEHYRNINDDKSKHLSKYEIDYNMFKDDFTDSKNDQFPLGPESIGLDFNFKQFKHVYGIPEHADSLSLVDTTNSDLPYRLYNVDIFEYETHSRMPLYGSIPFLTATKPRVSIGVYWINSADTFIDINKQNPKEISTHWISENGIIDFMVMIGEKPNDLNRQYGSVSGYATLPQLFSLGYHQCRWNYNDEKDVLDINSKFDQFQIPYDTIWLDIEYADKKRYFTWQPENFPDPARMLNSLDHTGRNLVIIIDPHIKTGYFVSDELISKKITINEPNKNQTYHGHCWPGESVWIDSMNPNSQSYWDDKHRLSKSNKFFGELSTNIHLWNDMNEPSVFDGPETSSPKDNLHYGNWEHRSIHNSFGLSFHESTYDSLIKRLSGTSRQRPFILTRSYFTGSQRTAAMWTGDNMSKWEYLKILIPMVLTSNIAGMPFSGADVGGFFGNPLKELLTRWYQVGIWYPFFRAHAHIDSRRREPWVAGGEYTDYMREAIQLRYSLLSVFYTEFQRHSISGNPVIKPMYYENPENEQVYSIEDQFYLGDSGLLIKPVTDEGVDEVTVYIPDDEIYYKFFNGKPSQETVQLKKPAETQFDVELKDIPMLFKGGSIIATKDRYRRSSKLMYRDPYTLYIAPNKEGKAQGQLYIDDGESFGYESGEFVAVNFNFDLKQGLKARVNTGSKRYQDSIEDVMIEKIVILGGNVAQGEIKQGTTIKSIQVEKQGKNVIIKKPDLQINNDWEIIWDKTIKHDEL